MKAMLEVRRFNTEDRVAGCEIKDTESVILRTANGSRIEITPGETGFTLHMRAGAVRVTSMSAMMVKPSASNAVDIEQQVL